MKPISATAQGIAQSSGVDDRFGRADLRALDSAIEAARMRHRMASAVAEEMVGQRVDLQRIANGFKADEGGGARPLGVQAQRRAAAARAVEGKSGPGAH